MFGSGEEVEGRGAVGDGGGGVNGEYGYHRGWRRRSWAGRILEESTRPNEHREHCLHRDLAARG
jgi:hypothetical protein